MDHRDVRDSPRDSGVNGSLPALRTAPFQSALKDFRSRLDRSIGGFSLSSRRFPKTGIFNHHTLLVHLQINNKCPTTALVPITRNPEPSINLLQWTKLKSGNRNPSGTHWRRIADSQIEPANRQRVCRRAKAQINVDAPVKIRSFRAIKIPASARIDLDLMPDDFRSHPSIDRHR